MDRDAVSAISQTGTEDLCAFVLLYLCIDLLFISYIKFYYTYIFNSFLSYFISKLFFLNYIFIYNITVNYV
jgi:hypothetical protein